MTAPYLEKFELMLDAAYLNLMRARGKNVSIHEANPARLREFRQLNPDADVALAIYKAVDHQVWNAAHLPWRLKITLEQDELENWHVTADDVEGFNFSIDTGALKPLFDNIEGVIEQIKKANDKAFRRWHAEAETWMKAYPEQIKAARKTVVDKSRGAAADVVDQLDFVF
jgi:hypothetical protein